jgi:hypothetical protein
LCLLEVVAPAANKIQEANLLVVDKIVTFLLSFDPRQIRFAGNAFSNIFGLVCSGLLIPVSCGAQKACRMSSLC